MKLLLFLTFTAGVISAQVTQIPNSGGGGGGGTPTGCGVGSGSSTGVCTVAGGATTVVTAITPTQAGLPDVSNASGVSVTHAVPTYAPNGTNVTPAYSFSSGHGSGMYYDGAGTLQWAINGTRYLSIDANSTYLATTKFTAGAVANPPTGYQVYLIGNTATGGVGTLLVVTSALPACSTMLAYSYRGSVSDATAPTVGSPLTGGGAVFANVHCSITTGTYIVDGL